MDKFVKDIIETKNYQEVALFNTLYNTGNMPVLHKACTYLEPLRESIVKAVYLSGTLFLTDIKQMFVASGEEQKIERAVNELIEDGYLIKKNTCMGAMFGLSREAVSFIKVNPLHFDESYDKPASYETNMECENSLTKRKITSSVIADYVLVKVVSELKSQFMNQEKAVRNTYCIKSFIRYVLYKEYMQKSQIERKVMLQEIGMSEEDASVLSKSSQYKSDVAKMYVDYYFSHYGYDEIHSSTRYKQFVRTIKKDVLSQNNLDTFYFLKDYQASIEKEPYQELSILLQWKSNVIKTGLATINNLLRKYVKDSNTLYMKEMQLQHLDNVMSSLSDVRKNIIKSNAYKDTADITVLNEAVGNVRSLESAMEEINKTRDNLITDFTFQILSRYTEDGCAFEDKVLTMKRMEKSGIFVENILNEWDGRLQLHMMIIQQQEEFFDAFLLHKKIASAFQYAFRMYRNADIHIHIYTATTEQADFVLSKLPAIKDKMMQSRNTTMLASFMDEIITVESTKKPFYKKNDFYKDIIQKMKGVIV